MGFIIQTIPGVKQAEETGKSEGYTPEEPKWTKES